METWKPSEILNFSSIWSDSKCCIAITISEIKFEIKFQKWQDDHEIWEKVFHFIRILWVFNVFLSWFSGFLLMLSLLQIHLVFLFSSLTLDFRGVFDVHVGIFGNEKKTHKTHSESNEINQNESSPGFRPTSEAAAVKVSFFLSI